MHLEVIVAAWLLLHLLANFREATPQEVRPHEDVPPQYLESGRGRRFPKNTLFSSQSPKGLLWFKPPKHLLPLVLLGFFNARQRSSLPSKNSTGSLAGPKFPW
jgi:hypothetical protein